MVVSVEISISVDIFCCFSMGCSLLLEFLVFLFPEKILDMMISRKSACDLGLCKPVRDLGLCKPVQYFQTLSRKNDIYGILPFVAPEVLRNKPYTPASDIYSFSMIMWEFTSGIPPFDDKAHNIYLALNICNSERPIIIEDTPQCYIDLMKKCWDENPLKRPDAFEVKKIINYWISNITENIDNKSKSENIIEEFYEADKFSKQKQINVLTFKSHPQAYHTSRLLDFTKQLNKILNQKENTKEVYSGMFYF